LGSNAALAAPAQTVSGEKDRKQVSITVYNQNFGLVREVRALGTLPTGQVSLEFQDVAATIQPETVHIRSLSGANALSVLEQNYRYDLLTPQTLLEKYVGKPVRVYRYHQPTGKEDAVDAKLLSVASGPVLSINGEITFDYGGRFGFKELLLGSWLNGMPGAKGKFLADRCRHELVLGFLENRTNASNEFRGTPRVGTCFVPVGELPGCGHVARGFG
jgi:hypothetical protein